MRHLVLLNGPPGSGKSSVADGLAQTVREMTALDVDTVKHALSAWPDQPSVAGLQAREMVLVTARDLLRCGRDVVIGQFLVRSPFIEQLASLARSEAARFVEIVLVVDARTLAHRLAERRRRPDRPEHAVNNTLVVPEDAPALVSRMESLLTTRPAAQVIDGSGTVDETVTTIRELITTR